MTKRFLILFFLALVGHAASGIAADAPITPNTVAVGTSSIVQATPFNINVDHGVPLTLSAPAGSVFIANPDIADVQVMSPTSIMIFGKRTGETTFMATDANGNTLARRTVIVSQDLADLRREMAAAIPGNKINVQSLPNGIVLTGEARDPSAVSDAYKLAQRYIPSGGDIINRIRVVGSNQIQIRIRFAEVSRSVNNTFGINWSNAASYGGMAFGFVSGAGVVGTGTGLTRPNNASLVKSNDVFGFNRVGGRTNINGMIDALARDGLVTILAEPNLTAMSGETANFLAGGEIPVAVPQSGGSGPATYTIEYKSYGVSLAFTPTLISENRINLHIKPEVSELTNVGSITLGDSTIQALRVRRAETTVELASGESFAIAGLMDQNQSQTVDKYPLLGDMPILGSLFRSNQFQSGQSELVVIITPYIVKPVDEQLALPMDGLSPPTEEERLLGLRYSNADPSARPMSGSPAARYVEPASPALSQGMQPQDTPQPTTERQSINEDEDEDVSAVDSPKIPTAKPRTMVEMEQLEEATMATPEPKPAMPKPVVARATPVVVKSESVKQPPLRAMARSHPTNLVPAGPGGFIME